jgi:hypothetical protein
VSKETIGTASIRLEVNADGLEPALNEARAKVEETAQAGDAFTERFRNGIIGVRGAIMGIVRVLGTFTAAIGILTLVREAIDALTDSSGRAAKAAEQARNQILNILPDESWSQNLEKFEPEIAAVIKRFTELESKIYDTAQENIRAGRISMESAKITVEQAKAGLEWRRQEAIADAQKAIADRKRAAAAAAAIQLEAEASAIARERMNEVQQVNAAYDDQVKRIESLARALDASGALSEQTESLRRSALEQAALTRNARLAEISSKEKAEAEQDAARAMEQQTRETERRSQVESQARAQAQRDQAISNSLDRQSFQLERLIQAVEMQTRITQTLRRAT